MLALLAVRMDHGKVKNTTGKKGDFVAYFHAEGSGTQDTQTITLMFNRNAGIVAFPVVQNYSCVDLQVPLSGHAL